MTSSFSVAARLSPDTRKRFAIQTLAGNESVSRIAVREHVSRKFLHHQKRKAEAALDQAFAPAERDPKVIFHLPVTEAWVNQLVLGLVLICHSSYRGVVELLKDLFGVSTCVGTVHNQLQAAAEQAAAINRSQDLSSIRVGRHDEIFQGSQPVLAGVDAHSTYCYLLAEAEHRDGDTWGVHLLDAQAQGFSPD